MLVLSVSLLIIGLILIMIEAMIPGFGVPGISGVAAIIASIVVTLIKFPLMFGLLLVFCELMVVAVFIYVVYKLLKRRQFMSKFVLDESLNVEKNEIGGLEYFLGKEGTTKTPLRPFGSADFNGFAADVYSDGNFILANKKIKVIRISENKIIVKEISELAN